jgi:integrase
VASIRCKSSTNRLFLDFQYKGKRCREFTALDETPANRKKLETLLKRIEAEITLGSFDYQAYFPGSNNVAKFQQASHSQIAMQKNSALFGDFLEVWYDEIRVTWRESYRRTIRGIIDNRLLPAFEKKEVGSITKADLLQFRAQLTKVTRKNGKSLSATHINRHMKVLRMILNEAADRFDFTSPYRNIKPLKIQKTDIDPFTLKEIKLILSTVRSDFKHYFTTRFFSGMRTGEIDGLKWKYVDFERRQIMIRETVVAGRVEYTKTDGSQRDIDMSPPVYDALMQQHQFTSDNDYVFCTLAGTALGHDNVTKRVWYPLLAHLGLRKRRPYQTRHTAATLWLASGENPEWIARQMGHANTEMLFRVYSRYVPNLTRRDGSAFDRLMTTHFADTTED